MPPSKKPASLQTLLVLLAASCLEGCYLRLHQLNDLKAHAIPFIVVALAAGVVYLIALYAFEHTRASHTSYFLLIAAAVLFRAPLWPLEPSLSDDLQRYRWDAKVQAAGYNPYAIRPDDPRLAPLRDKYYYAMPGRETPSVYPPATQLVFRATWKLFPGPVAFKTPFAVADLVVLLMLAWAFRSTDDRTFRLAVYAWNPLVIVEFAGSAHNDALALLGVVAALLIIRRHPAVSTMALTLAALAKVFPAVLLPVWLRRMEWRGSRQGWLGVALVVATSGVVLAPYCGALPMLRANLTYYEATWRNYHASLYTALDWLTGQHTKIPALAGVLASWGLALWLAARRAEPARAAYLLIGTILAFGPNGYSWYFTWIVPLLCFFPNPAWLLLTVLQLLSYNVLIDYGINGKWHFDPLMQWLVYAPFYALLLGLFLLERFFRRNDDSRTPLDSSGMISARK